MGRWFVSGVLESVSVSIIRVDISDTPLEGTVGEVIDVSWHRLLRE